MRIKNCQKHILILMGILLSSLFLMTGCVKEASQNDTSSVSKENEETEKPSDYHNITYNNKKYVYNSKITTVLYAGVDSDSELITYNRYTIAPRADSIELLIFDDYHKIIKVLAISRDTITAVERYTMNGNSRGKYDTQLGYAYAYGDGGKVSCTNLTEAVSELLGGIPIHEYAVTNNSSLSALNEMAGKITVTVPTDDLESAYPEFQKDAVVTLDESNIDTFIRWRDTAVPFSNNTRMQRQQVFISEFLQKFKQEVSKNPDSVWNKIESMAPFMETSITKNQYLSLADLLNKLDFSKNQYYYLDGKDMEGEYYDEVHLDQESLEKTIVELFYIEDGEVE